MHCSDTVVAVLLKKLPCSAFLLIISPFENRPLALSIFGLLIWLVQSGVRWLLGAVLGWRR
jgi:hypothetical protein